MKINLPYFYEIQHRNAAGKVSARARVDAIPFEIPEIAAEEMTVLASVDPKKKYNDFHLCEWQGQTYVSLIQRIGEGKIMSDMLPNGLGQHRISRLAGGAIYEGLVERGVHNFNFYAHDRQHFAEPRSGETVSSTKAARAEEISALAAGILIVSGTVWQRASHMHLKVFHLPNVAGPCVDVDFSKNGGRNWAWADDSVEGRSRPVIRLSLNDRQYLPLFADPAPFSFVSDFKVHEPEALAFDGKSRYVRELLSRTISATQSRVGDYPGGLVDLWVALNDARGIEDHSDTASLVETLAEFARRQPDEAIADIIQEWLAAIPVYDIMAESKRVEAPSHTIAPGR